MSQNSKSKRLWECSEPMTHGILTLLILTFRNNDESIKKMLLFLSLSKGPIPEEWQLPPPSQMWTDSLILEDQLVGLVHSLLSLRHSFAAPAYGHVSCGDLGSSWMGKSYCILDKAGFHDPFYAGAATCYSRKSSVSFHSLLPHTSSPPLWEHASFWYGPLDRPSTW